MKAPINTAAAAPIEKLFISMVGGIEAQEAQGQRSLVNSDTLPTEGLDGLGGMPGIEILEPVDGDPLFTYVKLPAGWSKRGTDHDMWSDLLDEKGRKRASIFYKAAFYDRRARIQLECRFTVDRDYDHEDATGEVVAQVKDAGTVVFHTAPRKSDPVKSWEASDEARAEARAWIASLRPDYENPLAYWGGVVMRAMPRGTFGPMASRTTKFIPTEKLGHLTPIREAACKNGNWRFRCDCSNVVTRVARDVRKRVAEGGMPKCSRECPGKPPEAVAP